MVGNTPSPGAGWQPVASKWFQSQLHCNPARASQNEQSQNPYDHSASSPAITLYKVMQGNNTDHTMDSRTTWQGIGNAQTFHRYYMHVILLSMVMAFHGPKAAEDLHYL